MGNCKQIQVRIDTLHVKKSESYGGFWGIGGEPGNSAEWNVIFTVNGESQSWQQSDIRDNSKHTVGYDFFVDITNAEKVMVGVSGVEIDDSSANDTLPEANRSHAPANNWNLGEVYKVSAANSDFSYEVEYTITCAEIGSTGQPLTSSIDLRYDGIWQVGAKPTSKVWGWTLGDFQKHNAEMESKGYRLVEQQAYLISAGQFRYDGMWQVSQVNRDIVWGWTFNDFRKRNEQNEKNGLYLIHQQAYYIAQGEIRYDGIWHANVKKPSIVWGWTLDDFKKQNAKMEGQGWHLIKQQAYYIGTNQIRYDGMWQMGQLNRDIVWGWTLNDFIKRNEQNQKNGLHLVEQQAYLIAPGQIRYDGIWHAGKVQNDIVWGWTFDDFKKHNAENEKKGLFLVKENNYDI